MDQDNVTSHDHLGLAEITIDRRSGTTTVSFDTQGTVSFSWALAWDESPRRVQAASISFPELSCDGLTNSADGRTGKSDPYLVLSVAGSPATVRTETVWNNSSPRFTSPVQLALPSSVTAVPFEVSVQVADQDKRSADDSMGATTFSITSLTGEATSSLTTQGTVTLRWAIAGLDDPATAAAAAEQERARLAEEAAASERAAAEAAARERAETARRERERLEAKATAADAREDDAAAAREGARAAAEQERIAQEEEAAARAAQVEADRVAREERERRRGEARERRESEQALANAAAAQAAADAAELAAAVAGRAVTRQNVNKMPKADLDRFVAALKKMMENEHGDGSSEFARVAGYHGWPDRYCAHGIETFPGWHRGYLIEFELALQQADKTLGGDGRIGMPYWDWSEVQDGNGPVLPPVIREHFSEMPEGLVPRTDPKTGATIRLYERGYSQIYPDDQIRDTMQSSRVRQEMYESLTQVTHWQHASGSNTRGTSVEDSHNSMHVAIGWPMTSTQFAAFHPVFWMHHCNVDRNYEGFLVAEGHDESQLEFEAHQANRTDRWGVQMPNRYSDPLVPFKHPASGADLVPADTFSTAGLGYMYDEVPARPNARMQEMPSYAAFVGLKPFAFRDDSQTVHVFCIPTGGTPVFDAADTALKEKLPALRKLDAYAGSASIFGGRMDECENCNAREPFNLTVQLNDALRRLGIDRHSVTLQVLVQRSEGPVVTVGDCDAIPDPVIQGPRFPTNTNLKESSSGGEVTELQDLLTRKGWYTGKLDGEFAGKTNAAVLAYQKAYALTPDGLAGPLTKGQLTKAENDGDPHVNADAKAATLITIADPTKPVLYYAGQQPGYMDRDLFLAEVDEGLKAWSAVLSFKRTASKAEAAFSIRFSKAPDVTSDRKVPSSDGQGAMLAQAHKYGIDFDHAERWVLQADAAKGAKKRTDIAYFDFLPVLVHEVGHLLGLPHTFDPLDVMYPYYRTGVTRPAVTEMRAASGNLAPASASGQQQQQQQQPSAAGASVDPAPPPAEAAKSELAAATQAEAAKAELAAATQALRAELATTREEHAAALAAAKEGHAAELAATRAEHALASGGLQAGYATTTDALKIELASTKSELEAAQATPYGNKESSAGEYESKKPKKAKESKSKSSLCTLL